MRNFSFKPYRSIAAAGALGLGLLGAAAGAWAQTPDVPVASSATRVSEIGPSTESWLELQRSNRAAAEPQPYDGAAATLAYQRYLQSFGKPIPTWFAPQASQGGSSGSGGSGGGSSGGGVSQ
ncbi:MAG: hypothetical protein GAK40_01242 [Burkholderia plantarii]|nr:MAG: hypothetical protein GAK40_01242 [Burkholderia plantarii]